MGTNAASRPITREKPRAAKRITAPPRGSLVSALFSSTQRRVLGLLFGQPERSFFATEIIALAEAGSGAVQRELKKLSESGLATVSRVGNQKHYQANQQSPIFAELAGMIRKTVGLAEPLRAALTPHKNAIDLALIYGSIAKGSDTAASDIDLLVISESLNLEDVYRLLEPVESLLHRKINPTLYRRAEFHKRREAGSSFLRRMLSAETIVLIGAIPDV